MIPKVAKAFYGATWVLTEDKLRDIEFIVAARAEGVAFTREEIRAAMGQEAETKRPVRMVGSVAVVPVHGVLSKRMNMMTEISGGTSSDQLKVEINRLADDPNVSAIVLDVDSPGGEVSGIEEGASAIRRASRRKRVVAVANDLMASGAYWLAAGANEIVATPTATVGSIGVYRIHQSHQGADEKAGIKTTIIRSSELKGMGNPYLDLSKAELAAIQANIDEMYGMFVAVVQSGRNLSAEQVAAVATGETWKGNTAVRLKLADRVASLDDVVAELAAKHPHQEKRSTYIMAENVKAEGGEALAAGTQTATHAAVPTTSQANTTIIQAAVPLAPSAEALNAAKAEERARIVAITETCKAIWPNELPKAEQIANEFINAGYDLEKAQAEAAKKIIAERKAIPTVPATVYSPDRFDAGPSAMQKFGSVAVDALAAKMGAGVALARTGQDLQRQREVVRLRHKSLCEIASESLQAAGVDVKFMTKEEIAEWALKWELKGLPRAMAPTPRMLAYGEFAADGSFQTTGDFPNILKDAANKTLLRGYMIRPGSWRQWVRIAEGATDLKPINRVRLSNFPTAEIIPQDTEYPKAKLGDAIETYGVQKYGLGWAMTWEMMVNDDLDAFGRRAIMMGRAIENTINRSVYQQLTGNPVMSDGVTLFHATHANLVSSGNGAPSHTQLARMRKLLRLQTGLQSTAGGRTNVQILGYDLRTLIVPASHETEARVLLTSDAIPDTATGTNEDAARPARNTAAMNQFKGVVQLVVEPLLDASSSNIYYGVADSSEADHVEISFLNGNQTPFVEEWYKPETKGRELSVDLAWGVKVIDWRGLVQNNGAAGV